MAMKITIKLKDLEKKILEVGLIRKQVAAITANIVAEEFLELLNGAPQYSGNFVANMAVAAGSAMGRKEGVNVFEVPKNATEAVSKGATSAIEYAKRENSNLVSNVANSVSKAAGWSPAITVYTRLDKAKIIEGLDKLRPVNAGGEHSMQQMEDRLKNRSGESIIHGTAKYTELSTKRTL